MDMQAGWRRSAAVCGVAPQVSVTGDAAPDVAWQRYAHPALWPTWSPQITAVEIPGERITPGAEGVVHGPLGVRAAFRVLAVDERARTWRWQVRPVLGRPLPVELVLDHAVGTAPGGCTTTLRITPVTWLAVPAALGYLPLALVALRRLVRR